MLLVRSLFKLSLALLVVGPSLSHAESPMFTMVEGVPVTNFKGHETIRIGDFTIPLFNDSARLEDNDITTSLDDSSNECHGIHYDHRYRFEKESNCVTVIYESFRADPRGVEVSRGRYCLGTVLQADGRDFKIKEVMNRCVNSKGEKDPNFRLNMQSPLIRLQDASGKTMVTEHGFMLELLKINETKKVSYRSTSCSPSRRPRFAHAAEANKCADDQAKAMTLRICQDMKGYPRLDTLLATEKPHRCTNEGLYCATYEMKCEF